MNTTELLIARIEKISESNLRKSLEFRITNASNQCKFYAEKENSERLKYWQRAYKELMLILEIAESIK